MDITNFMLYRTVSNPMLPGLGGGGGGGGTGLYILMLDPIVRHSATTQIV